MIVSTGTTSFSSSLEEFISISLFLGVFSSVFVSDVYFSFSFLPD